MTSANPTEEVVHTPPPDTSAFRRWFGRLNPPLQLVLMQLWMPVFLCVMFIVCYVGAFQHVAPRHVPVGVIGTSAAVEQYQSAADAAMPGAFDMVREPDGATARSDVRAGRLGLAYDVESNAVIVAGAHQAQAAQLLPTLVAPILGADETPTHEDIAPLPAGDLGMTPMYLMLAWCISGYLAAMFIGLMGGPLRRLTRFAVIGGVGLGLSLLAAVLVDLVLGAIHGHFFAPWGLGWAWAVAIGVAVNGLSYFVGRFIAAPAMTIFIFLSIPASGAAMPQWLMPQPFQWLNHVVVGSGISEMLKRLVYDVGPGYGRGWAMWAGYLVVGLVLTWVGKPYWEWRRVRRVLSGRTTMFQDAQRANGRIHERENGRLLAARGLARRDDGALVHLATPGEGEDGARTGDGTAEDGAAAGHVGRHRAPGAAREGDGDHGLTGRRRGSDLLEDGPIPAEDWSPETGIMGSLEDVGVDGYGIEDDEAAAADLGQGPRTDRRTPADAAGTEDGAPRAD